MSTTPTTGAWPKGLAPRDRFVPPVIWAEGAGGFAPVSRASEPDRWRALVDSDAPVVTQVDDGAPGCPGERPTSACGQPSVVAAMLRALDVQPGHRVLEIGAGTGWNAALLADRTGSTGRVVSVEIDPHTAERARRNLAGGSATVITGDGTEERFEEAPFDRLIATASVRRIPRGWIEQTRPGGVLVIPWGTDLCNGTLLRLVVDENGDASGRCGTNLTITRVRSQRTHHMTPTDTEIDAAETTTAQRSARELFEITDHSRAAFTIGLRVPGCTSTIEDIDDDRRHVEFHDVPTGSWARITMLRDHDTWTVHQLGPRRLWSEVDTAYRWWLDRARPEPEDYGLTLDRDGTHHVWLDTPDKPILTL